LILILIDLETILGFEFVEIFLVELDLVFRRRGMLESEEELSALSFREFREVESREEGR